MPTYRIIVSLLMVLGTQPALAASNGYHIVYDMETTNDGKTLSGSGQYYLQDGAFRADMKMKDMPLGDIVFIRRTKPQQALMLRPEKKTYMDVTKTYDFAESQIKTPQSDVPFTATGANKTIAGHSCKVMKRVVENREEEICVNETLMSAAEVASISAFSKKQAASLPKGVNGFPLEYIVTKHGKNIDGSDRHTVRVREFKKGSLSSSLFEIPSGYTKEAMPEFDAAKMQELMKQNAGGANGIPEEVQKKMDELRKAMEKQKSAN